MTAFDVIIVGSGAAGVSAAYPLADAGLRILIVDPDDGGTSPQLPGTDYLTARREAADQWRWMVRPPDAADADGNASSPKFRVPTLARLFSGFDTALGIETDSFDSVGSLAAGGLTAAWGAGVATFSGDDLRDFPISVEDLAPHYRAIAQRIGLAGVSQDAVSSHFGLDGLPGLPVGEDRIVRHLNGRYSRHEDALRQQGFTMGAPRLAVLPSDLGERQACADLGLCLWGCPRRAIYSASYDLTALKRHANLRHESGVLIDVVRRAGALWEICGARRSDQAPFQASARAIVLAAGTIATTKIVLASSNRHDQSVRLFSTPTAAFAIFFPALFGATQETGHGLAHHWYVLRAGGEDVCGALFPTRGLPVAEFVSRAPLTKGAALDVMRWVLPATSVGNVFFHSKHSAHAIELKRDGTLRLHGGFAPDFPDRLKSVATKLRRAFFKLGAIALPGSFLAGAPGSDVHYAGTLPMRARPADLETDACGELSGNPGVFVADGSVLTSLPAKSHTFTIMANAARIGTLLASRLSSR